MTVKVDYPAKLVGYRTDAVHDRTVLFEDVPVLFNDAELKRRMGTYRSLEAAGAIRIASTAGPRVQKQNLQWSAVCFLKQRHGGRLIRLLQGPLAATTVGLSSTSSRHVIRANHAVVGMANLVR